MRKLIFLFITVLIYSGCEAEEPIQYQPKYMACEKDTAIVAVIDSGFKRNIYSKNIKLCDTGHTDFSDSKEYVKIEGITDKVPVDTMEHGTNIAGIITRYAGKSNYCLVIIKIYPSEDTLTASMMAINYATAIGAKYVNYSGGGDEESIRETKSVKAYLDQNPRGLFIAAAGNDGRNLDRYGYYPAESDERVVVVASKPKNEDRYSSSNYGKVVDIWENGGHVNGFGITMSGTSQATAIATGKLINQRECDK